MTYTGWKPEDAVFKVGDVVIVYVRLYPYKSVKKNFLALAEITGYYDDGYKCNDRIIYGKSNISGTHHHTWFEKVPLEHEDEIRESFPKYNKGVYEKVLKNQIKRLKLSKEERKLTEPEKVTFT